VQRNRATFEALERLGTLPNLSRYVSPSVLNKMPERNNIPEGLRDPDEQISQVTTMSGKHESCKLFGKARVKSVLNWIEKTTWLGVTLDRCRKTVKQFEPDIRSEWKAFVKHGLKSENEITIDSFKKQCEETRIFYRMIIKTLTQIAEERNMNSSEKEGIGILHKEAEAKLNEQLNSLQERQDDESDGNSKDQQQFIEEVTKVLNWLSKQKNEIAEECLEIKEAIEMVELELLQFESLIRKAKICCKIVDPAQELNSLTEKGSSKLRRI